MNAHGVSVLFAFIIAVFPFGRSREGTGTTLVTPPWTHCLGLHKVTQFHLDVYSGYREKFNEPEGLFCIKLAGKDKPDYSRDDDELTVYGVNSGNHDIIYNKSLTSIGVFGGKGSGETRFRNPLALTGDAAGNLYVADTGNDRVAHLRYVDDELVWVKEIAGPESRPLHGPSGAALSGGLLYVADTGNDRIAVFRPDGSFVKSFGAELGGARLTRPFALAAVTAGDEHLYYADFFIAVTDSFGQRLWKLSPDGKALALARRSSLGGRGSFGHVAIDYYGSIYVTDRESGAIHKFTRYLAFLTSIGGGDEDGIRLDEPRGIACYRRFGQIFVSERGGAQYFWIGTDIIRFSADNLAFDPERGRCGVEVSFLLTEYANITLVLRDENGKERFTLLPDYILPPGTFRRRIEVDCPNAEELAKCKLSLVIAAKPTYSSREYITVRRESRLLSPRVDASSSPRTP
jgi:hypothetical protein